ncbi:MAG: exonuclease subunit SbcD [Kiritimatiellae bacterium]|nr:exonuclease subunit SbcD [Kiritimatiellia bacterium]
MKKIVHLADLHLGAKLHDRDRLAEQRLFLDWLCGLLAAERPDALVLAGDLFDVYYPPASVQQLWFDFLARVRRENLAGRVVAVAGNHDSPSALGCAGRVLDLVGVSLVAGDASADAEALRVPCADGGELAFAAIPFQRDGALRTQGGGDAAAGFRAHAAAAIAAARALAPDAPLVAVAHATVSGAAFSDAESERGRRSVGGLDAVPAEALAGADYVALGHLHLPQAVGGRDAARYAGAPLPMSFAEGAAPKSVAVAEFAGGPGEAPAVRTVPVPVFRPLRVLSGSREETVAAAAALAAENPAGPAGGAWAALSVTAGDGAFSETCRLVRDALAGSGAELVAVSDDRAADPGAAAGAPPALSVEDLRAIAPHRLAAERLAEPDLRLSEAERAELEALFPEVVA